MEYRGVGWGGGLNGTKRNWEQFLIGVKKEKMKLMYEIVIGHIYFGTENVYGLMVLVVFFSLS